MITFKLENKSYDMLHALFPNPDIVIISCFRGVGFLRYFQIKQIPNFLLASPILSIALCSIIHYVKLQPKVFLSLGFQASSMMEGQTVSPFSTGTNAGPKSADFIVKDTSSKLQGTKLLYDLASRHILIML